MMMMILAKPPKLVPFQTFPCWDASTKCLPLKKGYTYFYAYNTHQPSTQTFSTNIPGNPLESDMVQLCVVTGHLASEHPEDDDEEVVL